MERSTFLIICIRLPVKISNDGSYGWRQLLADALGLRVSDMWIKVNDYLDWYITLFYNKCKLLVTDNNNKCSYNAVMIFDYILLHILAS